MIKKKLETAESKEFWHSRPGRRLSEIEELPYIGESWWKAERELSVELLSTIDEPI